MSTPEPFQGLLSSWKLALEAANKSDRTVENYGEGVTRLADWLTLNGHSDDVTELTAEHIRGWLKDLSTDMAESTVRGRYIAVNLFVSWLVAEGELDANPMGNVPVPKVSEKVVPILKPEQLRALLDDTEGREFADLRDRALIMFFGDTGCRVSEVAGLGLSDVDLRDRTANVIGKGNKPRTVAFGSATAQALDRYMRARRKMKYGDRDWLWLSSTAKGKFTVNGIQQALRKRGNRLGFHVHPHMFRHGFADAWLSAGGSESDLMELAGWRTRQMLMKYGAVRRAERAREAYKRGMSPMDKH